jgi:hypothetical protein
MYDIYQIEVKMLLKQILHKPNSIMYIDET